MKVIDSNNLDKRVRENAAREETLKLAASQRFNLAMKFDDLLGDGGPPDETADEMIGAIRRWRDVPSSRSLD